MIQKVTRVYQVLQEMFEQRGGKWKESLKHIDPNFVIDDHLTTLKWKHVFIIINVVDMINNSDIKRLQIPSDVTNVIICTKDKFPRNIPLESLYKVEYFKVSELQYNITKHSLVPTHVIISNSETSNLIHKLGIDNLDQLPYIYNTDPVIKFLGGEPGQVVEIQNDLNTKTYRYIIDSNVYAYHEEDFDGKQNVQF